MTADEFGEMPRRWCSHCHRWEVDAGPPLGWIGDGALRAAEEDRELRRFLRTAERLMGRESVL
jgi:hypothetical protein